MELNGEAMNSFMSDAVKASVDIKSWDFYVYIIFTEGSTMRSSHVERCTLYTSKGMTGTMEI